MKIPRCFAFLFLVPLMGVAATDSATQAKADAAWKKAQSLIDAEPGLLVLARENYVVSSGPNETLERCALDLRTQGLEFYDKFPGDPRALAWLPAAVDSEPDYWADPAEAVRIILEAR